MKDKLLEKWKHIEGYEGLYEVSNYGKVRSLDRIVKGRWGKQNRQKKNLVPVKDKDGYLIITLCKDGKQKTAKIHRLVAQTFIPNINKLPCINHKDENKQNNQINNLEWCTFKYNTNYGTGIKKRIEKTSKPVLQYDLNGNFIAKYKSVSEAHRKTNISHIYDCCNKRLKTCGGYIWRYENGG